jgi:nitrate/nitrite transport system substrate-binding protein
MKASNFPNFAKESGFKPTQKDFIDGVVYDGRKPNEYINKQKIGLKGNDKL